MQGTALCLAAGILAHSSPISEVLQDLPPDAVGHLVMLGQGGVSTGSVGTNLVQLQVPDTIQGGVYDVGWPHRDGIFHPST